ncbi:PepSY domain-containing protein [Sulfitobacter mediterraneus]|uniref:PepSY domain-containing protein n=1 Tax=Sulfitobacter mediterraneus TaxID=83219 RepID=UPI001939FD2A|nr:PepSY domain-containing protein [Sulfitobacter mediterraneus]MBM1558583.1 PepSY domain-containing protein [Sulfitobacter mediterraneus]MBM1569840.1 PepSY domain-containing protein [Sulfitobacter mediterraneus]MBM1573756.1 PepSY domain-containing protein [Sulfitobacter mediterraneus]MBM1577585.1 PepSY domain-containing protein [Sulfitobacter mediterraneus]MBM1581571.1 PepSY domain-containing protein [Sulfitobacter mediterraneus]
MKKILLATTLIAVTATAFAVNAATDTVQPASPTNIVWMPVGEIVAKMEAQGYQVLEIEREDGRFYEVEMRDANGFEVEAYLDATTGEPLRQMSDMDDDDDNKASDYGDKNDD